MSAQGCLSFGCTNTSCQQCKDYCSAPSQISSFSVFRCFPRTCVGENRQSLNLLTASSARLETPQGRLVGWAPKCVASVASRTHAGCAFGIPDDPICLSNMLSVNWCAKHFKNMHQSPYLKKRATSSTSPPSTTQGVFFLSSCEVSTQLASGRVRSTQDVSRSAHALASSQLQRCPPTTAT